MKKVFENLVLRDREELINIFCYFDLYFGIVYNLFYWVSLG